MEEMAVFQDYSDGKGTGRSQPNAANDVFIRVWVF